MRNVLTFLLHQFLSTVAVMVVSPIIVFSIASILHIWWPDISSHTASRVLTTIPEFPIQTMLAFLFGFWLFKWTGQKAALWVWIIPAIGMLILLVHGPVAEYGIHSGANVFSHFFGTGCKPGTVALIKLYLQCRFALQLPILWALPLLHSRKKLAWFSLLLQPKRTLLSSRCH
jgi:hypothetical protein